MRVLVACEFSGVVRDAFAERGHNAWSCDLLPTEIQGNHIHGNVLDIINQEWDMMIAHPPCQYLCVSGNKYFGEEYKNRFPDREEKREDAIKFFLKLYYAPIPLIAIENPIGVMSTRFRKPDQIIQPYQFGHHERKSTCLWLKGLSKLIPTEIVKPEIKINRNGKTASVQHDKYLGLKPEDRWKARSRTYKNIAKAMAAQWG